MLSPFSGYARSQWARRIIVAGALIFVIIFPLLTENRYHLQIGVMILLSTVLATAVFPLVRMGLLFVAQAAFLAIGAYTATLLVLNQPGSTSPDAEPPSRPNAPTLIARLLREP